MLEELLLSQFFDNFQQVLVIFVFLLVFDAFAQLFRIQPAFEESNFLWTTNFLSLPVLRMSNKL